MSDHASSRRPSTQLFDALRSRRSAAAVTSDAPGLRVTKTRVTAPGATIHSRVTVPSGLFDQVVDRFRRLNPFEREALERSVAPHVPETIASALGELLERGEPLLVRDETLEGATGWQVTCSPQEAQRRLISWQQGGALHVCGERSAHHVIDLQGRQITALCHGHSAIWFTSGTGNLFRFDRALGELKLAGATPRGERVVALFERRRDGQRDAPLTSAEELLLVSAEGRLFGGPPESLTRLDVTLSQGPIAAALAVERDELIVVEEDKRGAALCRVPLTAGLPPQRTPLPEALRSREAIVMAYDMTQGQVHLLDVEDPTLYTYVIEDGATCALMTHELPSHQCGVYIDQESAQAKVLFTKGCALFHAPL